MPGRDLLVIRVEPLEPFLCVCWTCTGFLLIGNLNEVHEEELVQAEETREGWVQLPQV